MSNSATNQMKEKAGMEFCPKNVEVGDQVCFGCWTDVDPGTIVEVRRNGKEIVVQADDARIDPAKGGGIGHQNWLITRDEKGAKQTYSWRTRKGRPIGYIPKGSGVHSPYRSQVRPGWRKYYDWSF
jgi:hypothetical protein